MSDSFRLFRKLLSLRTLVYPLVFGMVALVGTGVFVQSLIGNRLLGYAAEDAIRGTFPTMDVQIGQLKTLGWNGIELKNGSVSPVGEAPALSFRSLKLEWGIESGRPVRIFCVLEDPIVEVSSNDAGELNWNRLLPPSTAEESSSVEWPDLGLNILIPTVEVRNGKLSLFDQWMDWSLDMGVGWSQDNVLTWQLHDVDVTVEDIGTVHTRSHIDGDGELLTIDIGLEHQVGTIEILGTVTNIVQEPSIELAMDMELLPSLTTLLDLGIALNESVVSNLQVLGNQETLNVQVVSNMGVNLDTELSMNQEEWDGELQFAAIEVERWLTPVERTYLDGSIRFAGTGLDWQKNLQGKIFGVFEEPVLWNQPLTSVQTQIDIESGELTVSTLQVQHPDAQISVQGSVDLLESTAKMSIDSSVRSIQSWVSDFEAGLFGEHTVEADWSSDTPVASVSGKATVLKATDHNGILLKEAQIDSEAQWDGTVLKARNQLSLDTAEAVGVVIPSMTSTINLEVDSNGGIRVEGVPNIPEVLVGEGTLQLNRIQGYFEYTEAESEPKLRTENMTVGEVVLVPAQYVVDGGDINLALVQDSLQAELHLLRKNRTFIHSKASAELSEGVWRVEQLDFSPTGDRSWGLKDGISFELTESGVGDLDLQLIGDAGDIRIKMDQYNDEPDIGIQIDALDVAYMREVANLFFGEGTIPMPMSGTLFGQLSLIGEDGRFEEGDYVFLQGFSSPDLTNNVDLYIDLKGSIQRVLTNIKVQAGEKLIAEMKLQVPTEDGVPSCLEPMYGEMIVSETSLIDLRDSLPVVPDLDLMATSVLYVQGTLCEPKIRFVGQGDVLVGAQGERFRWDIDLHHDEDRLQGKVQVRDGVKPVVIGKLAGNTSLSNILEGNSEAELFESIVLDARVENVYLQRLGRLIGFPDLGKGPVGGSVIVNVTPNDWLMNAELYFPKTRLAKHKLTADSAVTVSATSAGAEGDVLIDFVNKGALEGDFTYDFDDDSIFATMDWERVPATLLSIVTSDITNEYGKIGGHLLVDGTLADPFVHTLLSLNNVGFEIPSLGVQYKSIDMEADIENGQIAISKFAGSARFSEQGPLDLSNWGTFTLDSTAAYSEAGIQGTTRLELEDFPVINTDMAHATVSGSIKVVQDDEGTQFSGESYIHKAGFRLSRDFFEAGASLTLPDNFHIHRNVEIVSEKDVVDDWLDNWLSTVRGDIQLDLGDRVAIHTTMPMTNDYGMGISKLSEVRVDTILTGVLNVGWSRGNPTVLGTISTIRGSFVTMGKEFELGEGEVVFSGGDVYNPQLNLYAQKTFGEYGDIGVSVTGTVDTMELDFSAINSPYAYDQTDIVTLMLLGKPSQELANSESQTSGALIQAGLSSMGGAVGDVLSGSVVDNVDWDPTESMFRVGKTLSDTMFLSYMNRYGAEEGENNNEVTLEWLVLKRIYVEFITGDSNNTEANVYYRWIF